MEHNREKGFNVKLYAVLTTVSIAVFLIAVCIFTFASKYTAFHPEELARVFTDSIVQTGDGYNAYKYTLVSKNGKYGDFIRRNYIEPAVYRDHNYKPGDDKSELKGYNDESYKGKKTLEDDGTYSGELTQKMYPVYEKLVSQYGWDDYDSIFSGYIEELLAVREEIFGDKYFSDEVFFTAFEANVSAYGKKLTGTEDSFDENTGVQLTVRQKGLYEEAFGENYSLSVVVTDSEEVYVDGYLKEADTEKLDLYGVDAGEISQVKKVSADVIAGEDEKAARCEVYVVKIGMSWYIDNTTTVTEMLYGICE